MATASVTNTLVTGTTITAAQHNTNYGDLVSFLNGSTIHSDGSKAFTAAQAMGGYKLTGLAAATTAGDALRFEQLPADEEIITFSISGELVAEAKTHRYYPPFDITIDDMVLSCGVAPTGSSVKFDVDRSGTTIFTTQGNRPEVAAAAYVDTAAVPDVTTVTTSQYLTIEVDEIGSTLPGEDAVLTIRAHRT